MEKDEEAGDNVMHRGVEPEGVRRSSGEEKQAEERERRQRRNAGRGGGESKRGRVQGVCIWHWEAGKDSVGQAGRTCVFVFD